MLKFALHNLKTKWLKTLLSCIAMVLCTTIALTSYNTLVQVRQGIVATAGFYDTIVGPSGSPLSLVLANMFYAESPKDTMDYTVYQQLKESPLVGEAFPFAGGDSYRSAKIIGTIPDYLARYPLTEGAMMTRPGDVVVGCNLAHSGALALGDRFVGMHGLADTGHLHDNLEYTVVGILGKTNTAADNVIFTPIESVWLVHSHPEDTHQHDQQPEPHGEEAHLYNPEDEPDDHHEVPATGAVTAVLVKSKNLAAHSRLVATFSAVPGVQVASPTVVLRQLLSSLSLGQDILYLLAGVIVLMAVLVVYVTTAASVQDSRRDIQIMRLVGIRRSTIIKMLLLQTLLVTLAGLLLAGGATVGLLALINATTSNSFGIIIDPLRHYAGELGLLGGILLLNLMAALLSILPLYRRDPLEEAQ